MLRIHCPLIDSSALWTKKSCGGIDIQGYHVTILRVSKLPDINVGRVEKGEKMTDSTTKTDAEDERPVDFVDAVRQAVSRALSNRENVVMVRVSNDALRYLEMLVEAGITKSRSESVAFLVNEGIRASDQLFKRIEEITAQISGLRQKLSAIVAEETDLNI